MVILDPIDKIRQSGRCDQVHSVDCTVRFSFGIGLMLVGRSGSGGVGDFLYSCALSIRPSVCS